MEEAIHGPGRGNLHPEGVTGYAASYLTISLLTLLLV